jgi:hypothetical protein
MKLNQTTIQIPSIPSFYRTNNTTVDSGMYGNFSYILPNNFTTVGPVFLKSISGYYDVVNLDGI